MEKQPKGSKKKKKKTPANKYLHSSCVDISNTNGLKYGFALFTCTFFIHANMFNYLTRKFLL